MATTRRRVLAGMAAIGAGLRGTAAEAPDGFHVPAEDGPHEATFMQWPVSPAVYPDPAFLDMVQQTIADIANAVIAFEPVILMAAADHHAAIRARVAGAVTLWDIPTEDLWARDSGPIVVVDGQGRRAVRHIRFNGWGGAQTHVHDGAIAERAARRLGLPLLPTGLRGEAGGVEQDGHGLLIAHESSWVNENRNPGLSRAEVEAALLHAYGAERVIWAPGLAGEDITDYHIDSLARLTGPGRVLINLPDDPDPGDPFHRAAVETHDILRVAGLEIEVIPEPVFPRADDPHSVTSYANYYVCNGAVIASRFGDAQTDAIAVQALGRHYPGREVVTLTTDPLGEIGGGIHCATHELPA